MKRFICLIIILLCIPSTSFSSSDEFKAEVHEAESNYTWRKLKKLEGAISEIHTILTSIKNFRIIDEVQEETLDHPKLKRILNHFDKVIKEKGRTKESFIELYEYFNSQMPENKLSNGSIDIIEVLENGGDCNDVSPAFYSLFKYYGFNMYLIFGNSHNIEEDTDGLHAWIGVEFKEDEIIELDALWYGSYCELNRINGTSISPCDLKDEYVITKKFK